MTPLNSGTVKPTIYLFHAVYRQSKIFDRKSQLRMANNNL